MEDLSEKYTLVASSESDAQGTGQRDTGDPRSARAWLSAPCIGERAVQSLRGCLLAAGVPVPYAQLMTKHSPRHVLTESAKAFLMPPMDANEIGRWSLSGAQHDHAVPLTPTERHIRPLQAASAVIPKSPRSARGYYSEGGDGVREQNGAEG